MKIIYAICSWGLGHATRSLPVMRKILDEGHELTIISYGRSLNLLKKELGDAADYHDVPDYPMLLSENARQFMAKSVVYWPMFIARMEAGLQRLQNILKKRPYDRIISDGRYDMYSRSIPSFFISHQMRIMNPLRMRMFETGSETFNLFFFKRFCGTIVPDYKEDSLSGDLSHQLRKIDENKLHYVGVLSDFKKKAMKKDIDYLVSISGPEPQRTMFENTLYEQIDDLDGNVVITLGKSEKQEAFNQKNAQTYSFVPKDKRESLLNRARLVISRSGYSTMMDLAVIGAKALMVPTPGQIEQEYLGQYHNKKGTFYTVNQNHLHLKEDAERAKKTTGITRPCNVEQTVENIIDVVSSVTQSPFR
ncbi:MAG: glycosyltransferase [Candidatus Thermoplasmatota archaeon]|nr:glycosyltransferase [Candidatus Thermoplasmatota archaeon]